MFHNLTHSHLSLSKDINEICLCAPRIWPWSRHYRVYWKQTDWKHWQEIDQRELQKWIEI